MGVGCCLITPIAPITKSALIAPITPIAPITKAHTDSTRFNKNNL